MTSRELSCLFDRARDEHVFPGGVVHLGRDGNTLAHAAFGTTAYAEKYSRAVHPETIYDIASLTKLFTMTGFLLAARANNVSPNDRLCRYVGEFSNGEMGDITCRQLMNHTSELAIPLQSLADRPVAEWPTRIAAAGLRASPGSSVKYTCTGYYLLGLVIQKLTSQPLDQFIHDAIIAPLNMQRTGFSPLSRFRAEEIAPTERDASTGEALHGVVHDEAARAVEASGGVSGNAGLFSTAADVALFARLWLRGGVANDRQVVHSGDVRYALMDLSPAGHYQQGLGWHVNVSSWMSSSAPTGSAGHAGFTGPTVFISPGSGHHAVILNNRVFPTRNGPPRFSYHRRIAEWLLSQAEGTKDII